MTIYCQLQDLENESDVEQKFIYKLLTSESPQGLGFKNSDIKTKPALKAYTINKGKQQKVYRPDYLIVLRGLPLLVIEVKSPDEEIDIAFAEAQMYASIINSKFPHKITICNKIIVSNGKETWCGYSDCAEPELKLSFEDFYTENEKYNELLIFCSKEKVKRTADEPYILSKGKAIFNTPVSELGGKRVQDAELVSNTYGATLVFENSNIFDPKTEADRTEIVRNAYVPSAKREQHIEPIYREIKKINLPSNNNTTLISTDKPKELIEKIEAHINNDVNYSLMLLIGNAGSGKTTFIRYFKEKIHNEYKDISDKCDWIFIDMNSAPVNNQEIYNWIKISTIEMIKSNHPQINFNDFEIIKKIFSKEIKDFEDGLGKLLLADETNYKKELYDLLKTKMSDPDSFLKSILSFLKRHENRIPIMVLDNCDKRTKDDQLLMFQVAQWIKDYFKCIVILPMRDSTYDVYKNIPPLDTLVKDLVFRIDPPDYLKVLQARLEYITRLKTKKSSYDLPNGASVIIKPEEQIEYFKCMLMAIRKNTWASNIFYKLSNRNTREAIQLFEDLCKSGHIVAEDIFKMRTLGEEYELSQHKIINALLRKNRKYFDEKKSNFVNLFSSSYLDDFPDPFVRVDILKWLEKHVKDLGSNAVQGYHKVEKLIADLQNVGHDEQIIYREINNLVIRGLILNESQTSQTNYTDLIRISPSGSLHLALLKNLSYLSACAEDVIYKDTSIMTRISKRIANSNYLDLIPLLLTAKDMIEYLEKYRNEFFSEPQSYLGDEEEFINLYDLSECKETLTKIISSDENIIKIVEEADKYRFGTIINCRVVHKNENYVMCNFDEVCKGFLATYNEEHKLSEDEYNKIDLQDNLICKILDYDAAHKNYRLEYIENTRN